jgi:hypothetical protein
MVESLKRTRGFNSEYMLPWHLHLKLVPCSKIEASLIPLTTPPPELDHHETADLGIRDTLRVWKWEILDLNPKEAKNPEDEKERQLWFH